MFSIAQARTALVWIAASVITSACGGGSGDDGGGPPNPPGGGGSSYQPGVFLPATQFANKCAAPIPSGNDTESGLRYGGGTVTDENNFLRSFSNDLYLWYRELPDIDPSSFSDPELYFDRLKTNATTPSGKPKDNYHFTYLTPDWLALSQSGISASYGAQWVLLSRQPPRSAVVAYIEPNSPAANAGLTRGDMIVSVDGVDLANTTNVDALNNGMFPRTAGETHTFQFRRGSTAFPVTMTSANVTSDPVQNVQVVTAQTGALVGYLTFNDHIRTAESQLIDAVTQLRAQNITELVLDLRYNGGGSLALASEMAYMIGGSATSGKVFERYRFNDKHPSTNPVTGTPLEPLPFLTTAQVDPVIRGRALPTLNLQRVFVLTGPTTCSASESIMNGLLATDVEVIQIGSTTCGKPYGFYPEDNCGITYFTIQLQGVNDQNYGDYADGFSPVLTPNANDRAQVRGCPVADDFTRQLGNPAEARLAAALQYIAGQGCPAPTSGSLSTMSKQALGIDLSAADGHAPKSIALTNRILPR